MKRVQKILLGISAFTALGLGASSAVLADPTGMMGGPEACPYERGERGSMGSRAKADKAPIDFAAAASTRLDKFKAELKITPAQEPTWQAFAGKTKQQVEAMQTMRDKMLPPKDAKAAPAPAANLSAPERMDKGIELMKQRLTNMEAMNAALKDLYNVLTPEQKIVADRHFSHHMEAHRERMRRGR